LRVNVTAKRLLPIVVPLQFAVGILLKAADVVGATIQADSMARVSPVAEFIFVRGCRFERIAALAAVMLL
jgi:hypothetical protein